MGGVSQMNGSRLLVVLAAVLGMMNTGCGIIGWSLSSKAEVTSYTVPRTQEVRVSSLPEGATVVVDGAEAGPTPRKVKVPLTELRHRREQSKVPGLVGLVLDLAFGSIATAACISANSGECALVAFGSGLGLVLIDTYLVFGRTVSNESSDVLPAAFDIGVRRPGYQEQTRRIRVPDLTDVNFLLVPVVAPPPAGAQPPAPGTPPSGSELTPPPPPPTSQDAPVLQPDPRE
jgi:hypothetical protein